MRSGLEVELCLNEQDVAAQREHNVELGSCLRHSSPATENAKFLKIVIDSGFLVATSASKLLSGTLDQPK